MFPLRHFRVKDRSMEPEIREGDRVLVNTLSYVLSRPKEGDVVVVRHPEESRYLVKRIVRVEGKDFFILGDNRDYSVDSRQFGPVPRELIIGRVLLRLRR